MKLNKHYFVRGLQDSDLDGLHPTLSSHYHRAFRSKQHG